MKNSIRITKNNSTIDCDELFDCFEFVKSFYLNGPFMDLNLSLDFWYKSQKIMMITNPELVELRKKEFNTNLNKNLSKKLLNIE